MQSRLMPERDHKMLVYLGFCGNAFENILDCKDESLRRISKAFRKFKEVAK